MAHNWSLQIDRQGWIDLHSFELTMGKPAFSVSVALTASTRSLGTCSGGKRFSNAKVVLRAPSFPNGYLQYNFTNAWATNNQLLDVGGTLMKTIWFAFEQLEISHMSPSNIVTSKEARLLQFDVIGSPP